MDNLKRTFVENNREIQQVVYSLSHDLSAPIRHINSFHGLLMDNYGDALPEQAKEWLGYIERSADKAGKMVMELLIYSRLCTSHDDEETFSLSELLENIISDRQNDIDGKNARIDIDGHLPVIYGLKKQWAMALTALLDNALTFQPPNQPPLVVFTYKDGALRVEDNGIGVENKYHKEMAKLFKCLNHQNQYPGTGMGLAHVERILGIHGGTLSFERSTLGGLAVVCSLPSQLIRIEPG